MKEFAKICSNVFKCLNFTWDAPLQQQEQDHASAGLCNVDGEAEQGDGDP